MCGMPAAIPQAAAVAKVTCEPACMWPWEALGSPLKPQRNPPRPATGRQTQLRSQRVGCVCEGGLAGLAWCGIDDAQPGRP
eukprot:364778-Chlamydomonas_euryale.AAC.4